jgi:hypothetical protein
VLIIELWDCILVINFKESIKMNDTHLKQISRYIEKAKNDLLTGDSEDSGALLFMGEMQDPIPRTLIIDSTLNANDVRVWMLLRISIANPSIPGKLPSQKELSQLIQCSEMTIWSSMQILRINRWLSLCERVKDQNQMNRGNIYAIHSEPMSIGDTLTLDESYLSFIEQSMNSKTKRIKTNAMAANLSFYKQIHNNEDSFNRTQLQQHDARLGALQNQNHSVSSQNFSESEQNYYSQNLSQIDSRENGDNFQEYYPDHNNCGREKLSNIKNGVGKKMTDPNNCGQKEMAQQSHSSPTLKIGVEGSSCSSSNIYNNKRLSNTTTTTRDQVKNLKSLDRLKKLISPSEFQITLGILKIIDDSVRQDVVDQITGRLVNFQKTGYGQIYNFVGFLQKLRSATEQGTFAMDSNGLMIRNAREETARVMPTENHINSESQLSNEMSHDERKEILDSIRENCAVNIN